MQWLKGILSILKKEPENWLAYLHGQKLQNVPHLMRTKPRYRGLVLVFLKFVFFHFRHISLRHKNQLKNKADFFIYAGTKNQAGSLDATVKSLSEKGMTVVGVADRKLTKDDSCQNVYEPFCLSISEIFKSFVLLFVRKSQLSRIISNDYPYVKDWCVDSFLNTYPYLIYFYHVLIKVNPWCVIVSNDHSVPNRCLLAVAHHLSIKTAYLQHASVSSLFPALRFDYAFLDGKNALEAYQSCEINQPETDRKAPMPIVFLSGQKKRLKRKSKKKKLVVGLALNALDDVSEAVILVEQLNNEGHDVCIRWHPSQVRKDVKFIQDSFVNKPKISLSDPMIETVGDFLEGISWLIAGNSSIHLEAALARVYPIYFELTPADIPDYYRYVKHGLAKQAESANDIIRLLAKTQKVYLPDVDAVRHYSATYLTEWDGKEGELVAECLIRLSNGKEPPIKAIELYTSKQLSV